MWRKRKVRAGRGVLPLLMLICLAISSSIWNPGVEAGEFAATVSGHILDSTGAPAPNGTVVTITYLPYNSTTRTVDEYGFYFYNGVGVSDGDTITVNSTFGTFAGASVATAELGRASYIVNVGLVARSVDAVSPSDGAGYPGDSIVYTFHVKNAGNALDAFQMDVSSSLGWSFSVPDGAKSGGLKPDETFTSQIVLNIPDAASAGAVDMLKFNATSLFNPLIYKEVAVQTTVSQRAGVSVSSPPTVEATPGSLAILRFVVTNTGNGADDFQLAASCENTWAAAIDGGLSSTGTIAAGDSSSVNVTVQIPNYAPPNSFCKVTLEATSQFNSSISVIGTGFALVAHVPGIEITSPDDSAWYPGTTARHDFVIKNTGNSKDTISISARTPLCSWETNIEGGLELLVLKAGEERALGVFVNIPKDALNGTVCESVLSATSSYGSAGIARGHVNITVSRTYGVSVSGGSLEPFVGEPGQAYVFNFTVRNTGNDIDDFYLDVSSENSTWTAGIVGGQTRTGTLEPGEEVAIQVSAQIPKEAMAQDEVRVFLKATSISNPTVSGQGAITVRANQMAYVEITVPSSESGKPGTNASLEFLVKNTGNGQDMFWLFLELHNASWKAEIADDLDQTGWLAPGEVFQVTVNVTIPEGLLAGEFNLLNLTAGSIYDGNLYVTATAVVGVGEVAGVSVKTYTEVWGLPGESVVVDVNIANIGNYDEYFEITVEIANESWIISYPASIGPISPGKEGGVQVVIKVPNGAMVGDEALLTVKVSSVKVPLVYDEIEVEVITLQVASIGISKPAGKYGLPGLATEYYFTITNTGNGVDSFTVGAVMDIAGWGNDVAYEPKILGPGESMGVVLTIYIPPNTVPGAVSANTMTVSSNTNTSVVSHAHVTTTAADAHFTSPLAGGEYISSMPIALEVASVPESALWGTSVEWFSDVNGHLGSLQAIEVVLSPGSHMISVNISASGQSYVKTLEITVLVDTDGDGIRDESDWDSDNDGVPNDEDAYPLDPFNWTEPETADPNDWDGDGVANTGDMFPQDADEWADFDDDGVGDNLDRDDDNDGTPDENDAFPNDPYEWKDTDGDGIGDETDSDRDGDGVPDDVQAEQFLGIWWPYYYLALLAGIVAVALVWKRLRSQ